MEYLIGFLIGGAGAAIGLRVWSRIRPTKGQGSVARLLVNHFPAAKVDDLIVSERKFPHRVRADLQKALDECLEGDITVTYYCGIRKEYSYEGVSLADCMFGSSDNAAQAVPPEYEEVDVGEAEPVRVVKRALWLLDSDGTHLALLFSPFRTPCGPEGLTIQIQAHNTPAGIKITQQIFDALETSVQQSTTYRGKILSLEKLDDGYRGTASAIRVHKIRGVERDQIILPLETITLLERNVIQFIRNRERLSHFSQSIKKGLLFYGPPGTGKTHTIHYLTKALEGHTTLVISAEQVQYLGDYMALARLLQPSVVVLEDVDLIARDRGELQTPGQESLLNKLLNEMDGLKEDAAILFILTTNRPEALEAALASRPGRVDQAIEFPLPDEEGRRKLVRLYSQRMDLDGESVDDIVRRTEGVSAAFIKELMRRSVQFHLEQNGSDSITRENVAAALDEMLFAGGPLNLKLLGADSRIDTETCTR